jgi:hypothetical protein
MMDIRGAMTQQNNGPPQSRRFSREVLEPTTCIYQRLTGNMAEMVFECAITHCDTGE